MVPAPRTERAVRIGYARTSTARQELASQLEALRRAAPRHKIFQEQISTRVKVRPELEKALALAHQFKEAAPETPVIVTVSSWSTRDPAAFTGPGRELGGRSSRVCR